MSDTILHEPPDLVKLAQATWQASVNAETVSIQRQEIIDQRAALGELAREKNAIADELKALKLELSIAVVKLANGKRTTLWSILEDEQYRPICFCQDAGCTGCVPIDARTPRAIEAICEMHATLEARIQC